MGDKKEEKTLACLVARARSTRVVISTVVPIFDGMLRTFPEVQVGERMTMTVTIDTLI